MTAIFRHIVITFIFLIIIIDMVGLEDAIEIISTLENAGIKVFIDGGWGVDALLGYQSRAHNDIDIFIESSHKDNTFKILSINGYKEIKMDYSNTDHSVWKDKKNRIIDLHIFSYSSDFNYIFEGQEYESEVFSGTGKIGNIDVVCIPPEYQVLFHLGYERDDNDIKDVLLICKTFNIEIPSEILKEMSDKDD